MNVSLTPQQEQFVQSLVDSGAYLTADEVVREALLLFQEREHLRQRRLEEVRKQVAVGIEQADRGEVAPLDIEAILAESRGRLADEERNTDASGASHNTSQARPA
jgi:antitoxin ParD1/3/4